MSKLTAKQQAFCEAYVSNGFNAAKAAVSAGYSEKAAKEIGCRELTKANVAQYVADFKEKATERAIVTVEDVANGLMKEARGEGEDTSTSARVAAWKALSDYTGGFDSNKIHNVNIETTHEEWLDSLK